MSTFVARKFILTNSIGQTYDLSTESADNTFLSSPTGLGLSMDYEWGANADMFYVSLKKAGAQGSIAGTLVFYKDAYKQYQTFLNFINKSKFLKIGYFPGGTYNVTEVDDDGEVTEVIYQPPKSAYYYARCELKSLEKSEISPSYVGVLACGVEFVLLTPWAKETSYTIIPMSGYNLIYPSDISGVYSDSDNITKYPSSTESNNFKYGQDVVGRADFSLTGSLPGAFDFIADGPMEDPEFQIFDGTTDELISSIQFEDLDVPVGSKIEFSNRPDDSYVRYISENGIAVDITDYLNIFTRPFYRPENGNYYLRYVPPTGVIPDPNKKIQFKSYDYHRSV